MVTTVQDSMMSGQPVAFLVPTTPTRLSAPTGTINAATGEPERVVYNSAVVMTTGTPLVSQQVMYAAAPQPQSLQPSVPIIPDKTTDESGQVRPSTVTSGCGGGGSIPESIRERQRSQSELRPRNPATRRMNGEKGLGEKGLGEKGLGKAFYLLEQLKQETTDADRTIKTQQSDMRFMVRA